MALKFITASIKDEICTLTLNTPPRNILNIATMEEINDALEELRQRNDFKVIVFDAQGDNFSFGADVKEHTREVVQELIYNFHKIFYRLDEFNILTAAKVKGLTFGGGFELAMFCDFVLAREDAVFSLPEINLGVFPPIALIVLPELIGKKMAQHLIFSGEKIDAKEAKQVGLVTKVFAKDTFDNSCNEFFKNITKKSFIALELTKKIYRESNKNDFQAKLRHAEDFYLNKLMWTFDANEGIKSFIEKRQPVWQNK